MCQDVTLYSSVVSITAHEQWLGFRAADNSRSLFQQTQDRLGGSKSGGWQLPDASNVSCCG